MASATGLIVSVVVVIFETVVLLLEYTPPIGRVLNENPPSVLYCQIAVQLGLAFAAAASVVEDASHAVQSFG